MIAKIWEQPRYPLTHEWIKKIWCVYVCMYIYIYTHTYIHTMEYDSAINRNKFESVEVRCINLQLVIQSEVSQKEKNKSCILEHIYGI